MYLKY
jgi:hypothetical protein